MNIRTARKIAVNCHFGRGSLYSFEELSQAFHRLDRSVMGAEHTKRQSDRHQAKMIWDYVGTLGEK